MAHGMHAWYSVFSLMYVISIKGYWTITKLDDGSPFVSWINGHALRLEWTQYRTEFSFSTIKIKTKNQTFLVYLQCCLFINNKRVASINDVIFCNLDFFFVRFEMTLQKRNQRSLWVSLQKISRTNHFKQKTHNYTHLQEKYHFHIEC